MKNVFWIGVQPNLSKNQLNYILKSSWAFIMSRIILMANDMPGALVARYLVESGDKIVRLYLHEKEMQKFSKEIIKNSLCDDIFSSSDLKKDNHTKNKGIKCRFYNYRLLGFFIKTNSY